MIKRYFALRKTSLTSSLKYLGNASINLPLWRLALSSVTRGYTDYQWYNALGKKGVFFVNRLKKNARYRVVNIHEVPKNKGVVSYETIELVARKYKGYRRLRKVKYINENHEDGPKTYVFVTNHFKLSSRRAQIHYALYDSLLNSLQQWN